MCRCESSSFHNQDGFHGYSVEEHSVSVVSEKQIIGVEAELKEGMRFDFTIGTILPK